MAALDLSIIIVSHNTKDYIGKAITSVFSTVKKISFEVIVVENASSDGSYTYVKKHFPQVTLVQTKSLVGFSEANNLGAKMAIGEYLFFLNPDTKVYQHAINILVATAHHTKHPKILSGQLRNPDGTIQPQGGAIPTLVNVLWWAFFLDDIPLLQLLVHPYQQRNRRFFQEERQTGWVGGTALLIPRDLFVALGGWDAKIFLYGEDVELCLRAHLQKNTVRIIPGAQILHNQHKSTGGVSRSLIGEMEALVYIWRKHFPAWQLPILKTILVIGCLLRVVLFGILLGDETRRRAYLNAQKRVRVA